MVVSYNATKDVYGIRDPASEFASVLVPAAALDAARTSFGTDEVTILYQIGSNASLYQIFSEFRVFRSVQNGHPCRDLWQSWRLTRLY